MLIDNDLILQWEPKIQRKVANTFIVGMDRDDIAQELRIAITKAAKAFNKTHGTIFHTYLHTTMENTVRTLMTKAQKQLETTSISIEANYPGNTGVREVIDKVSNAVTGNWRLSDGYNDVEVEMFIDSKKLNHKERKFIELRQDGMTMEEITKDLGENAYKVRLALKSKFLDLAQDYNLKG